jgi:arsenite-transporting ATPase
VKLLKDLLLDLQFLFFGGKGGVGKTTCATSCAIWAAEHGRNTLIISTDPAHSLGDSLGVELKLGELTKIEKIKNLTALEIDPQKKITELQGIGDINPMNQIGRDGMMGEMVQGMFEGMMGGDDQGNPLNPPGIDETLAFGKVLEYIETDHEFDLIICDTAPTGHTLRLLGLPETLSSWIGRILKLRFRLSNFFGKFKSLFGGDESQSDTSLELLKRMNDSILRARSDLTDPKKNSFIIVMIPEEMAIAETSRLLNELIRYNIPNSYIIVNQFYEQDDELCTFCRSRRAMQKRNLQKINSIFKDKLGKKLIIAPLYKDEIRGVDVLREFGQHLIH